MLTCQRPCLAPRSLRKQDAAIFWIGALVTLICFGLIWWYLG